MKTLENFKDQIAQDDSLGYYDWDEMIKSFDTIEFSLIIERLEQAAELYAEYMAIEFDNWAYNNCEDVDGGRIYKGKTYSTKELYKIFKQENNQ